MCFLPPPKNILKITCLLLSVSLFNTASASIINADFSDGLNSWSADYSYFDGVDEYYFEPVIDFNDFTENFSTGTNSVTLNTSMDGDDEYFGLYLFQEFEVADDAFELSLNYDYYLSDEDLDFAFSVTGFAFPIQRALSISKAGRVEMIAPEFELTR